MSTFELRPYQRAAVEKAKSFDSFGFFDEQRTGKTPTVCTLVAERHGADKVLVVCPKSAVYQWSAEYKRFTNQPAVVVTGSPKKRSELIRGWYRGALIMSYDTLKTVGTIDAVLDQGPQVVIADEAHRFKTVSTAVFKTMRKLIRMPYRYALTGTPAHGKPEEIYAILFWLRPDQYPSKWNFIGEHFRTMERQAKGGGHSFTDIIGWKAGMQRKLQKELSEFTSQNKRKDVMPWLPIVDHEEIKLPLTTYQQRYLKELEEWYETEDVVTQGTLDRLVRYRQICLHPALLALKGTSPKLNWVLEYLDDYPETPTVIFSKFTSFLRLLSAESLPPHGLIIGDTPAHKREEYRLAFQRGDINLLLINIDAGKEALTLDRGECIIFTDLYPPISDVQQAEDRIVATTQDKADKPQRIIRLMMEGSYDERIHKLLTQRASAVDVLNDYKKYLKEGAKSIGS